MTYPAVAVNATPLDAALGLDVLPGDAVATGPEVLPTEATQKKLKYAPLLMLTVVDLKEKATRYFEQVYRGSDVRVFSSPAQMVGMLAEYSKIDQLVILTHAFEDSLVLGPGDAGKMMTIAQLQTELDKIKMPRIDVLNFDGCTVGRAAPQLYVFAEHFAIPRVEAWTYFHHLEIWGRFQTNPNLPVPAPPEIDFAAPYLPIDTDGAHVEAAVLKAEFAQPGQFTRMSEFFTFLLEENLVFADLLPKAPWDPNRPPSLEPWTQVRTVEDGRYPRSELKPIELTSSGAAGNFVIRFDSDKAPYRVIVKPALP